MLKNFLSDNRTLIICLILLFLFMTIYIFCELFVHKEIIKKSEEYTIFKECEYIQGNYYCK